LNSGEWIVILRVRPRRHWLITGKQTKQDLRCGFLVASQASRSARIEETTPSLFPSAISAVLSADGASHAVDHAGEEEESDGSPHEGESLNTEMRRLAVLVEFIATLNVDSAIRVVSYNETYNLENIE
jgi:hypothetical protein